MFYQSQIELNDLQVGHPVCLEETILSLLTGDELILTEPSWRRCSRFRLNQLLAGLVNYVGNISSFSHLAAVGKAKAGDLDRGRAISHPLTEVEHKYLTVVRDNASFTILTIYRRVYGWRIQSGFSIGSTKSSNLD